MKKLFTVLLLSFSLSSFSQTDSTRIEWLENDVTNLKNDIRLLKSENKNINLRLEKFTQQYFIGVSTSVIGWLIGGVGAAIYINGNPSGAVIGGLGGVIGFSGSLAMIASHNKLKREQKE